MHRLLILGGGTAGTIAANKLRTSFPQLQITVVDQDNSHHYQPGYLFLPFGIYDESKVVSPRKRYFKSGIRFIEASVDRVDSAANVVSLADGRSLQYDTLIIATGVTPRPDQTTGMAGQEFGLSVHEFYTLAGAKNLAHALKGWRGGELVVHIAEMPIKCPVAPLEFIFLLDDWLDQRGLRKVTKLRYVTPLDGAFTKPVASAQLGDALTNRNIELEPDFMIESVDNADRAIVSYDGRRINFDLLVTVPVNMGQDFIQRSGLGNELNLVPCDKHTMLADGHRNIFVLGDAGTLPTSKAGAVAHFSIDIFIDNFAGYLAGLPLSRRFDGHANCFIESGRGKGMLLDFNYDTEPLTGTFPLPKLGPMKLLAESTANHYAKLAFRWVYWHILLPGRPLGIPADMFLAGKNLPPTIPAAPDSKPSPSARTAPAPAMQSEPTMQPEPRPAPLTPAFDESAPSPTTTPPIPKF